MPEQSESSRRSIRIRRYDYSQPGSYFFTICTHEKKLMFGQVRDGQMKCNRAGKLVWSVWWELPSRFPSLEIGEFIVMPNHVHGILVLRPQQELLPAMAVHRAGRASPAPTKIAADSGPGIARAELRSTANLSRRCKPSVSDVIGAFKSLAAIEVNRALKHVGTPVWQRNFYEHILRTSEDVASVRRYISENPRQWSVDRENPRAGLASAKANASPASWLR